MCQTTVESFKIVSRKWCLSYNTNAINWHIFGFINGVYKITNHVHLIFELHVYSSRERGTLELSRFINEIKKIKLLEKKISQKSCKETGAV